MYKKSKVTISEQVNPVILEYPVRLGESTSTGCRSFNLEKIPLNCQNLLIPDYTPCLDVQEMLSKIKIYLDNYTINIAHDLYTNFNSTYDNAVSYLLDESQHLKINEIL